VVAVREGLVEDMSESFIGERDRIERLND